jgi:hypothetical protein
MREHYDFSNAIKNPFAERMKKGYTIIIEHEDYDEIIKVEKSTRPKNSQDNKLELLEEVLT